MYRIGILQLTQNLDEAVQGFKCGLSTHGLDAEYFYLNADGNVSELPKLANQIAELKVDLIFACSTPAAKAAVDLPFDIPVVFTPVFDPIGAGLVNSFDNPGGKATGISGMVSAVAKILFIKELLPNAKKIGILYHCHDSNALIELNNFRTAAQDALELAEIPVERPEDLSNLPDMLPADLDALFLPIGRIIEDNFATIAYYTDSISLPIIASHAPNIPAGALGGLVADHKDLGKRCADQAFKILKGTAPAAIPVEIVKEPIILLNSFAAQNLGISLPEKLLAKAKEVYE